MPLLVTEDANIFCFCILRKQHTGLHFVDLPDKGDGNYIRQVKSGWHLISGNGYKGTDHVPDNGKIEKNLIAACGKSGPIVFNMMILWLLGTKHKYYMLYCL